MTQRNETVATAFEQVASRMVKEVEDLSDSARCAVPAGETRTVGQIAYHMAEVYDNVNGFIRQAVAGQPLPALTMEIIDGFNAEQAIRYADASCEGALEMLRQNSGALVAALRTLNDAQLDTSTVFFGNSMTVRELAQNALVRHTEEHLASIQNAAASA